MEGYQFVLPQSFDPSEFLTGPLTKRLDDARYLVALINMKTAHGCVDDRGGVPLRASYLRNVMAMHDCKKVIDALIEGGGYFARLLPGW